ncbi:MAG TPA: protein kinase [Thermoanaerobaculia bacterium]
MTHIGSRVGHFQIVGVLGRGGMGEVYEGFDETLQRRVALKSIRADRRIDASARNRFLREARMLSQLDHPGICRIYDYVQGEQSDLLVLELIEGKTLRSASHDPIEFREKLRIATAVAGALAAAHRLGIVHRDLKPDNVMLTSEGGVKVLDFGLARVTATMQQELEGQDPEEQTEIEDPDAEDDAGDGQTIVRRRTPSPRALLFGSETRVGDTVGTPAYMSPEQARGENLTTASDMYSFGLLLQSLFSGTDPYEHFLTPALLMERAARGESAPVTGVDRDVTTLINDLKVADPAERPTASDVVRRLERIATRGRRRLRRALAAAAVVLIILATAKYISDVRRERNVAITARADAERRRGQAEELIGFMVGDLRAKLEPVGRLDVLDDVGAQALRYFASLRPDEITPAELRRNAKTLSQIGEVRMAQGNLSGADEVLRASLALATSAAARAPNDGLNHLELGASHFWIGTLRRQQGDLAGALSHYRSYLRVSETLARVEPANPDYRMEVGYGHSNVGTILEQQGELAAALTHYSHAMKIIEERMRREPEKASWKAELATAVNKTGVVLLTLGRYGEAEQALRREKELLTSALLLEPNDVRRKFRLAVNLSYLASLFEETGKDEVALTHYQEERQLEEELARHDPENTRWQRSLASTESKIARLLHGRGDLAASEASFRNALGRLEPLLALSPDRVLWRLDIAAAREGLSLVLLDRGRLAAAQTEIDRARAVLQPVEEKESEAMRMRWRIAATRGIILDRAGDSTTARAEWSSVVDALWSARNSPAAVRDSDELARALLHLGRLDDARPLVERLLETGYRRSALIRLWEAKRSVINADIRTTARKGSQYAARHRHIHPVESSEQDRL